MSNDKNAQELLKWGLAHSTSTASGPSVEQISADIESGRRPDLADPKLYEAIMGKSEAQMMREELAVAMDPARTVQDRCTALDNFEMLIEQIDNANNMTSMNMWPALLSLLTEPEPEIQTAAAWIVGTAVQNNDKAQMAVLDYGTVQALIALLGSANADVRAKAMYALSGLLKHNPAAMHQFDKMQGWNSLRLALRDPNMGLRRKTAFLINALLFQDPNSFNSAPTASSTTTSTATAVAPVATSQSQSQNPSGSGGNAPAAPLERGPATQQTSIPHPNVARALLDSGILTTLLSSLLPPGTQGISETDLPPPSGPDGDADPRSDLDFAEKAASAILTFTHKLPPSNPQHALDPSTQSLFAALLKELEGKPLDAHDGTQTRWSELGIDPDAFAEFKNKVHTW